MKEEVFYKHVRETSFTKDYTVCGKVVEINTTTGHPGDEFEHSTYELHIGVYVFRVDEQFIKKNGIAGSFKEATDDPLVKIKLGSEYSLQTFLDFTKTLVPAKAVKKKVYIEYTIE